MHFVYSRLNITRFLLFFPPLPLLPFSLPPCCPLPPSSFPLPFSPLPFSLLPSSSLLPLPFLPPFLPSTSPVLPPLSSPPLIKMRV